MGTEENLRLPESTGLGSSQHGANELTFPGSFTVRRYQTSAALDGWRRPAEVLFQEKMAREQEPHWPVVKARGGHDSAKPRSRRAQFVLIELAETPTLELTAD